MTSSLRSAGLLLSFVRSASFILEAPFSRLSAAFSQPLMTQPAVLSYQPFRGTAPRAISTWTSHHTQLEEHRLVSSMLQPREGTVLAWSPHGLSLVPQVRAVPSGAIRAPARAYEVQEQETLQVRSR